MLLDGVFGTGVGSLDRRDAAAGDLASDCRDPGRSEPDGAWEGVR